MKVVKERILKIFLRICAAAILFAASIGCSTTRLLPEGASRLARNHVTVEGNKHFNVSEITPYIKQQPNKYFMFGWNPFLNIYNWSDGSDKWYSRMWRKIGVAPVVFNPASVEASVDNVSSHLRYLGYYNSNVTSEVVENNRKAYVTYRIKLGKRYTIDSLVFDVPQTQPFRSDFSSDSLKARRLLGKILSEKALEAESVRSASEMRKAGYYDFSKANYSFFADTLSGKDVTLQYRIKSYGRSDATQVDGPIRKFTVGNVSISRPVTLPFKEKSLREISLVKPGDLYDEEKVSNTYTRFSSLRVFNSVGIEMKQRDSSTVDCNISLTQSKVQGVKFNLEASSNSSGLLGLSPQLTYYHKNIFHGGEWLNLGFNGNFQFRFGDRTQRSEEFGISAGLSFPKVLGIPYRKYKYGTIPRTEVKLSYSYQDRPEYNRNIFSTSLGFTGKTKGNLTFQLYPLRVNYVLLNDLDPVFAMGLKTNPYMLSSYMDHLDAGIGGTLFFSTSKDLVPKTSYSYAQLNFDLSGNLLSLFKSSMPKDEFGKSAFLGAPFAQYVKGELSLGRNWRWGRRGGSVIATRLLLGLGYAYGNSDVMPFEKQLYCGGAGSMRGWQARALGPGNCKVNEYFVIPSQTGDLKLEADMEYRQLLFWKIESALFAEVGNVWNINTDDEAAVFDPGTFYRSLAADWGLGLRLNLDFIIIRFDLGFKVYDPARDLGYRWCGPSRWFSRDGFSFHFGVGYPF